MMKRYFTTLSLIICCLLTSSVAMSHAATTQSEPFPSFINQFGQSAKFQLTRIKFPLKSPIVLLADDGETEKSFPFTQDMWPLLEEDALKAERIEQEDGSVYVSHFVVDNATATWRNASHTCAAAI